MKYVCILIISLFSFSVSSAQLLPPTDNTFNEVNLIIEPEYPNPGETFTASLQSYSQNLQGMHIEWLFNNTSFREGVGMTTITGTTPTSNNTLLLTVKIQGVPILEKILGSTGVDILWEANTYTPEGYLGRALPVDSSTISAIAVPRTLNNTGGLIYTWYKDGRLLTQESGFEKNIIEIKSPGLYTNYNLSVEVSNTQGVTLAQNGVKITTVRPELLFYEKTALLGTLLHTSLSDNSLLSNTLEKTIIAQPYYFSTINPLDLIYTWRISNIDYLEEAPNSLILRNVLSGARITLEALHPSILLQSASTTLTPNTGTTLSGEEISPPSPFGEN